MAMLIADPTGTLLEMGYETGLVDDGKIASGNKAEYTTPEPGYPMRLEVLTDYAREGDYSLRSHLVYGEYRDRAESKVQAVLKDGSMPFHIGETRYHGLSVLVDPDQHDYDRNGEIIFQVKQYGQGPSFALYTGKGGFLWLLELVPGEKQYFFPPELATFEKGVWYDWVIAYKPSYTDDGFIQLFVRKQGVAEYTKMWEHMNQPNLRADLDAYQAWGIYKATYNVTLTDSAERMMWHDSIRIAETFEGAIPVDHQTGTADADEITGTVHANRLQGLAGNDVLNGGEGEDLLEGGRGKDTLNGGGWDDTASYEFAVAGVRANLAKPSVNSGVAAGDVYISVEGLLGSRFADELIGSAGANMISGGAGRDRINGNNGHDALNGNSGNDTIRGGGGNDTVTGGTGNDQLWSGSGADQFFFGPKDGNDILRDFQEGTDDLVLSRTMFTEGMTVGRILSEYARKQGKDLVFNFDSDTKLTIVGGASDKFTTEDLVLI